MTRYFHFELALPEDDFLPPFWQQQRAGDNMASVYWLYNRTGEPWLLDLAAKIHRNTANWTGGIANWHNVNMAQGFREPGVLLPAGEGREAPPGRRANLPDDPRALRPGPRRHVRRR